MYRNRLKSGTAAASILLAGTIAGRARADDLTISSGQSTPVATATAANNTAGNITVASGGSVTVATGTAATINSSNTLTNNGTIAATAATGAVGVAITGTGTIGLVNNAAITLSGTGAGNIGVSLTGAGAAGTIASGTTGTVTVAGDNAYGVLLAAPFSGSVGLRSVAVTGTSSTAIAVTAPLTGSLTLAGSTSSVGAGGYGVLVAAPVSGTIDNTGTITAGSVRSADTSGTITAGLISVAGVRISSNVGGGFVNDRYYTDSNGVVVPAASVNTTTDTLVTGSIVATGTAPALWVAPNATAPAAIALGAVGTGNDAYAIVNRGILQNSIAAVGSAAVALRVGGGGATTTLAGGIISQASATIFSTSLDASATGIDLLAGAVVPQVVNQGTMTISSTALAASGTTPVGPGGAVYAIVAEPGANVGGIVNTGTINALAVGANNGSYGILDRSGSITSINNSGTLLATSTGTGGFARAIDLTGSTAAVTVTNSGTITGDIVLGNGPTTLALTGGTISGAIGFGTSAGNLLAMSGASTLTNVLTTGAPIAVTLADTARLDLTNGPTTLSSVAATGASVLVVPVRAGATALTVNGTASFTGTSTVQISVQSLALAQNLTIVQANGGITTDHLATLIDASTAPFLFTATAPVLTANTLGISLTRKTAAEVGLTGSQAALYDQSIVALANSPAESSALANLPSQAAVIAAYRQITPPSFGRAQLRAAQSVADTGFGAAADRMAILTDFKRAGPKDDGYGIGIWAQQTGDFGHQSAGANEGVFNNSTYGIAGGIDTSRLGLDAVGIAFLSDWSVLHHDAVGTEPGFSVPATTTGVAPYAAWSWKALFVEASGLAAHIDYSSKRTLTIGSLTDTVTSSWKGTQFAAGLVVGAKLDFGRFRITPSNSIAWTSLRQSAYTEGGAGAFALAVARQKDSVTTDTGKLALAYLMPVGDGKLKLEAHGAYAHQFNADPTVTVASFVSGGSAIALTGDSVRAEEKSYGADVGFTQESIAFRLGYDRRQASGGFRDQSVAVTAGLAF